MKLKAGLILACIIAVISLVYNIVQFNGNKAYLKENAEKEIQLAAYSQIMSWNENVSNYTEILGKMTGVEISEIKDNIEDTYIIAEGLDRMGVDTKATVDVERHKLINSTFSFVYSEGKISEQPLPTEYNTYVSVWVTVISGEKEYSRSILFTVTKLKEQYFLENAYVTLNDDGSFAERQI